MRIRLATALLAMAILAILSGTGVAEPAEEGGKGSPAGGPPWMRARIMFQLFDTDRDGLLTADQVPENAWFFLSAADANGDGGVTSEEVVRLWVVRIFTIFDDNGDQALTAEETPEPMWDRLSVADADGDGIVTGQEIIQAFLAGPPRGGHPERP